MERSPKLRLWACCSVTAVILACAGSIATAPASQAAQRTAETGQAAAASSQWSVNGANSIDIGYDGTSLVYSVTFTQTGSSLTGTLNDPYYPTSGPVSGSISGSIISFTFDYPAGSIQGTRTYTGVISSSGAVSGTWTQTGDESPDNGTWSLASDAVAGSSAPTPACTAATAAYQADEKALDNLLNQLRAAQSRQTDDANRVSELTKEVDADNALIARYKDLESSSDDDAGIVGEAIASFTEEARDLVLDKSTDAVRKKLEAIASGDLDPEEGDIKSDVAGSSWDEAAAAEGEEVAAADEALEAVEVTRETVADRLWLFTLAKDASRIVTADIALKTVLVQLEDQEDAYNHANDSIRGLKAALADAKDELNLDNEEVSALNGRVDAAQAAAQAALIAMTSACRGSSAG